MEIRIPEIHETIALADYAPEFGEQTISVWVNPPLNLIKSIAELDDQVAEGFSDEIAEQFLATLGQLWGWPAEDVRKLYEHAQDTTPALFTWLVIKTLILIKGHRLGIKKNWTLPSMPSPGAERPASL